MDHLDFHTFAKEILKQRVTPPSGMEVVKQINDKELITVRKDLSSKYKPSHCWYNCKAHTNKYGGDIVFGWALFFGEGVYQAQHHAVWLSPKGELVDLTPDELGDSETAFLVDGRVPFDFDSFRFSPNFNYLPDEKQGVWGIPNLAKFERLHFILKAEPTPYINELLAMR
ncbi:hypothetical protein P3383_23210 [Vibrio parahaemolyticus]|nr:hypothetical protein [Vibrio parahaemolyticus]